MASSAATLPGQTNQAMSHLQHWSDFPSSSGTTAIENLPADIEVITHLRPHDLTKLARVSRKYREFAQSVLWSNIELHRQDAHHACFGLSTQKDLARAYLDGQFRNPWSYRGPTGKDFDFDRRNMKFGTAIRKLYRSAGKSQAWNRLAPFLRHLCLTVTHKSPPHVWNMMLSLPNLTSIEVIGEYSEDNQAPPVLETIREPAANVIGDVRLRGYIPGSFVSAICTASASSIANLDLGILELPRVFEGDEEEQEMQTYRGYPLYVAPRGTLWYQGNSRPALGSLKHLLLCKRGNFDGPPDMSEEEDFEIGDDEEYDLKEIKQWASILRSIRSTVVEIVLEQRPIYLDYLLRMDMGISPHDQTSFIPELESLDSRFYRHILKDVFDDRSAWPKLKKLIFRGFNLHGFEEESGEVWSTFTARALPGVEVEQVSGNYMFFNPRKGTIMNQHGVDGLKPYLDMDESGYPDDEEEFMHMLEFMG